LVAIPMLLAMAPAVAQTNIAYVGQSVELRVAEVPGDTYSWELYDNATGVNFATDAGNCPASEAIFTGGIKTGPVVHITWFTPGTYYYKVTSLRNGCSMNLKVGKIIIEHPIPTVLLSLTDQEICIGESTFLKMEFTGTSPWRITYRVTKPDASIQDITVDNLTGNPSQIPFTPTAAGTYTIQIISITDANRTSNTPSNTAALTVHAKPAGSRIYQYDPKKK
jgi:hypothetical protein